MSHVAITTSTEERDWRYVSTPRWLNTDWLRLSKIDEAQIEARGWRKYLANHKVLMKINQWPKPKKDQW